METEDWGDESRWNLGQLKIILIVTAIIFGSLATAFAVYKITSPPSDPVNIAEPATLSKPSVNATSGIPGDTIQIRTTLSDSLEGIQIFFYENDVPIGSAFTNSEGLAIFDRVIGAPGTYIYTADCIHP